MWSFSHGGDWLSWISEWLEAGPAVKTHAASSRVVSLVLEEVGGATKLVGLALMWWRRESRTAWLVRSASLGRSRWMAEGWGRFERSSRRCLGSWWGLKASGFSLMLAVFVGDDDEDEGRSRRVRVGDSMRQAQRWMGWRNLTMAGGGRQSAWKHARNLPASAVWWGSRSCMASRMAVWSRQRSW